MQGRRKLFNGGGLSKIFGHHGAQQRRKIERKKHWLKRSKTVSQNVWSPWLSGVKKLNQKTKFGPKYKCFKTSYLDFFFENIFSDIQLFYIRPHVPVDIIRVFFNFRFFSRKSQRSLILQYSFAQKASLIL